MIARILTLLMLVLAAFPARAADYAPRVFSAPPVVEMPYPHENPQAQAVAAARDCFRLCELQCSAGLQVCLGEKPQRACLPKTDACDRACQRQCRSTGNLLLDLFE